MATVSIGVRRIGFYLTLCLAASPCLTSCATKRATYLDNGVRGYVVTCGGVFNRWDSCLVKAGKICRDRGYDTIESGEYDRTLIIACKSPSTK